MRTDRTDSDGACISNGKVKTIQMQKNLDYHPRIHSGCWAAGSRMTPHRSQTHEAIHEASRRLLKPTTDKTDASFRVKGPDMGWRELNEAALLRGCCT